MIRSIRPTDLVRFARFNERAFTNEARTLDDATLESGGRLPLRAFIQEWLALEENRHTWLSLAGPQLTGVISIRNQGPHEVWEIDRLRVAVDAVEEDVAHDLIGYLSTVAAEMSIQKILLRLDADSALLPAAHRSGFGAYAEEHIYELPAETCPVAPQNIEVRTRRNRDAQPLFRFYSRQAPAETRRSVAMTMQEWEATHPRLREFRRSREIVAILDDDIVGWGRLRQRRGQAAFELLATPEVEGSYQALLAEACRWARRQPRLLIAVRGYQPDLKTIAEDLGARERAHYQACVNQLAVRIRAARWVPVGA